MQNREILLESKRLESYLINFQIEGALLEVMKNDLMARSIIAEHRKIEKYALQLGLIDKRQLNEGIVADVALGIGQTLGSIGSVFGVPLGSAFGAAGVIWYGKEMLAAAPGSFDFFMNLIFALFSAAAIDPTGTMGVATNTAKLFTPFIKLGNAARALGRGVVDTGKALAFVKQSGPLAGAAVKAASAAEPAVVAALPLLDRVVAGAGGLLTRITPYMKNIPGAGVFESIIAAITKSGAQAWAFIKECLTAVFNVARATGAKAGAKAAGAVAEALPSLIAKLSPQMAEKIVAKFVGKQFSYTTKKGAMAAIEIIGFNNGKMLMKTTGGAKSFVAASELPSVISQIARLFGGDAAAAAIVSAKAAYPQTIIKNAISAASGVNNATTIPAAV
jgi:hypothetical protein